MTTGLTVSSFQNSSFSNGSATTTSLTTSGRISASSLYNTDNLENKYEYNETKESYETKDTAQDEAIATEISNILYQIEAGYEDEAMEAYSELIALLQDQSQYSTLSDSELQAVAKSLLSAQVEEDSEGEYTNIQDFIVDFAADADENYMQKVWFKNSKVDSTTEEDLLETICGVKTDDSVSTWTKIKGALGNLVSFGGLTELFDFSKHH